MSDEGGMPISCLQAPRPVIEAEFGKWLESNHDLLEDYEHRLRGERRMEDDEGTLIWAKETSPYMNSSGIHFLIFTLSLIANKNTNLSNLDEPRINDLCLYNSMVVSRTLWYKMEEFQLDPELYDSVCESFNNVMELALRRATNEGERRFLGRVVSESHVFGHNPQPQQKKGGFLGLFPGS
jgi:hypothetical protein